LKIFLFFTLENRGKKILNKAEKLSISNPFLLYIVRLISQYSDFIDGLDFRKKDFLASLPNEDQKVQPFQQFMILFSFSF
jgi:hypothetical protein